MSSIEYAYPAGYESEASSDEWDLGFADKNPKTEKKEADIAPAADNPASVLKWAIGAGREETVLQLLDSGLDVDTRLDFDWTPLMCAVSMASYNLTKLLLDRGANFSKDHWTVLMGCCTASAPEYKICSCLELLLTRNADPNMMDSSHTTCLMLASRDGLSKVINLLVSHGANVNTQDLNGFTALCFAVQYGREESVLKLLQLGANKNLKTKTGKTAADLALQFKHTQITSILASTSSHNFCFNPFFSEKSRDCASKLDELELFFHGLGLGSLTDIIIDHDISWSHLLTMDKDDLHKIGITEPDDQQTVLTAVRQMEQDKLDLETVSDLGTDNTGSELHTFLLCLRQHCSYLTDSVEDVISRFPCRASQIVFSLDPHKKAQAMCNQLLIQTKDLQREITQLRNLLCQMDQTEDCCDVPPVSPTRSWRKVLQGAAVSALGVGALLLWVKGRGFTGVRLLDQWSHW